MICLMCKSPNIDVDVDVDSADISLDGCCGHCGAHSCISITPTGKTFVSTIHYFNEGNAEQAIEIVYEAGTMLILAINDLRSHKLITLGV